MNNSYIAEKWQMYINEASIIVIMRELENRVVNTPAGKTKWCKHTIETIFTNEKYTDNVMVYKTYNAGFPQTKYYTNKGEKDNYISVGCNPAIISEELFKKIQEV